MNKNIVSKIVVSIMLFSCFAFAVPATTNAANLSDAFKTTEDGNNDPLDAAASTAGYDTSNANTKINTILASVIKTVLSLLGVMFLGLMIYGGFLWMTAKGNESQVEKSRNLITAAMIGLGIVVGAYAITFFILSRITTGVLLNT